MNDSPETDPPSDEPEEIRVQGLSKSFGSHSVLRGINLSIRAGELVAIVGASGSGKTVLLNCIIGLHAIEAGRVLVRDHSAPGRPLVDLGALDDEARDRVRLHWAVVFQKNALFSGTVFDNCAFWLRENTGLSEREIDARIRDSVSSVGLDPDEVLQKDRDNLSGGMAKRVAIARAVAMDPIDIFYDEPTTGLDPIYAAQVHELIFSLHHRPRADRARRTTVIVTHDKDLLRRLRPRVIMLHDAGVVHDGSYEHFLHDDSPIARRYLRAMPVLHARPTTEPPQEE